MPGKHALLSASSSHRWLTCPPSARLEETKPRTSSKYADEGTLAHELAELKLQKYITPMSTRTFNSRLKKLQENPLFSPEMMLYTEDYAKFIHEIAIRGVYLPHIAIEKEVNFSAYAPEGFGTCDCLIVAERTLRVIDFKYGQGVKVSAENNTQMRLYALGAYQSYKILYPINTIEMVIHQPRLDNISRVSIPVEDLLTWGESIKSIAQKAFAGEGEFAAGEHCRFCSAKATCRSRHDANTSLEDFGMKAPLELSLDEIGTALTRARDLKNWLTAIEDYALTTILGGGEIPGWKAVEGRSARQFIDTDAAIDCLTKRGYDRHLFHEQKTLSLTQIEKVLKKDVFEELLGSHVIKAPGKPTLAPVEDVREAFAKTTAAQDFKEEGLVCL